MNNRQRIADATSSFPGIHLRGLHRLLGISMGTLRYHLGKMENEKEIFCEEKREEGSSSSKQCLKRA
jgi:predicted transcriptional regulator